MIQSKDMYPFEIVTVAGQHRITKDSFERWLESQSRYQKIGSPELPPKQSRNQGESVPETPGWQISKSSYPIDDLMEATGLDRKAIYEMIQNFEVIALRIGKSYLIPGNEFHRILKERGIEHVFGQTKE